MEKFRVTCIVDATDDGGIKRMFATRQRFPTRQAAETYAKTIDSSREPKITVDSAALPRF